MKVDVAQRLAFYRKQKGLTQEELAALSGITSRTIQRIEGGQVIPQMHSVKLLAKCLDIELQILLGPREQLHADEKISKKVSTGILAAINILPLIGIFIPLSNILVATVFWLLKKDDDRAFDIQGRMVVNFHITISILAGMFMVIMVLYFPIGYPLLVGIYFYAIIICIWNAIRVLNHRKSKYPLTIRFLKTK